jgi:predicted DCC family thiol-disulfide oxidoreductase YuxK
MKYLIFDGNCQICCATISFARGRLIGEETAILDYHRLGNNALTDLGLSREKCEKALALCANGKVFYGGAAIWQLCSWHPVVGGAFQAASRVPVLLFIVDIVYRITASARSEISGGLCAIGVLNGTECRNLEVQISGASKSDGTH